MTQEVGQVDSERGKINYDQFPIGTLLYMYPYHVCTEACLLLFSYEILAPRSREF